MPTTWVAGSRWSDSGVSNAVYVEDGQAVCSGTNVWQSRIVGLTRLANGDSVIRTQTNEAQSLEPITDAPASTSCPSGQPTHFNWQENFYLRTGMAVRDSHGSSIGFGEGLNRSEGGNTATLATSGHPDWDVVFSHWEKMPPTEAGSVVASVNQVAASSIGTTVTFTYIAPPSGIRDGTLMIDVPLGWTAPAATDAAGCATATTGSLSTSGQTIIVSALTLPPHHRLVIDYGATSGGPCRSLDGATAPSTAGNPIWQVKVALSRGAASTDLTASPYIRVTSPALPGSNGG
jgi:hypothetical protein